MPYVNLVTPTGERIVDTSGKYVVVPTGIDYGLIAHYKLDETSGTAIADSSGNGYNGISARDVSLMRDSGWLKFNGTNDYIWTPFTAALGDFTVAAIFKDASGPASLYERIVDKDYAGGFFLGREGLNANRWGGSVLNSSSPYGVFAGATDGLAHSIVARRSGTTHTIWIDGQLAVSQTVATTATSTVNLRIGINNTASSKFSGWIRDVRVYPFAISDVTIVQLYINTFDVSGNNSIHIGPFIGL